MTTLSISAEGEVCLTLRGPTGNRILTTLRHWPHWHRHEIERDPVNTGQYLAVTLITDPVYESTLREILKRSFGMTFEIGGGNSDVVAEAPVQERRRRW